VEPKALILRMLGRYLFGECPGPWALPCTKWALLKNHLGEGFCGCAIGHVIGTQESKSKVHENLCISEGPILLSLSDKVVMFCGFFDSISHMSVFGLGLGFRVGSMHFQNV
jgi:hypothetical protein